MNRLRKGQLCPIHHSYFCCGRHSPFERKNVRPDLRKKRRPGVRIEEDKFHPRGYREICSKAEMGRRKFVLAQRIRECFYCRKEFTDYDQVETAHLEPKGMGGARHDDHMDNLTLAHHACNTENGSKRPAA